MGGSVFGIDFDGTICDTTSSKIEYLRDNLGLSIQPWQANRTALTRELKLLSDADYDLMLGAVCSRKATLKTGPLPKACESLELLCHHGRAYIVTGRRGLWLSAAMEWMHKQGIDGLIEGYISSRAPNQSKVAICRSRNITHLVDDDPGQFSGINGDLVGVLMQQGYVGGRKNNGVKYARDWDEALGYLIQDSPA